LGIAFKSAVIVVCSGDCTHPANPYIRATAATVPLINL
jgi:hypothetical protein